MVLKRVTPLETVADFTDDYTNTSKSYEIKPLNTSLRIFETKVLLYFTMHTCNVVYMGQMNPF